MVEGEFARSYDDKELGGDLSAVATRLEICRKLQKKILKLQRATHQINKGQLPSQFTPYA